MTDELSLTCDEEMPSESESESGEEEGSDARLLPPEEQEATVNALNVILACMMHAIDERGEETTEQFLDRARRDVIALVGGLVDDLGRGGGAREFGETARVLARHIGELGPQLGGDTLNRACDAVREEWRREKRAADMIDNYVENGEGMQWLDPVERCLLSRNREGSEMDGEEEKRVRKNVISCAKRLLQGTGDAVTASGIVRVSRLLCDKMNGELGAGRDASIETLAFVCERIMDTHLPLPGRLGDVLVASRIRVYPRSHPPPLTR